MRRMILYILLTAILVNIPVFGQQKVHVVTTLSTYADIAKQIGGNHVNVTYLVQGNQNAHFIRPKPSYAKLMASADLFVTTGLDLEIWVPTLVEMSKNPNIRSGQKGFVAAADGVPLLEKPVTMSREEGDLHIYGNPHIVTGPQNIPIIARNILIGLKKVDPQHAADYQRNFETFRTTYYQFLYGEELVNLLGENVLQSLAEQGNLIPFLKSKQFKGKYLIDFAGGLLKKGSVLYGKKIVAYHKNWVYLNSFLGLEVIGYVEPKPGIPPSPKHVKELIDEMKEKQVKVVLAANYFDEKKVNDICEKVGAIPVIVPMGVDKTLGLNSIFDVMTFWVDGLVNAYLQTE
ncbi:MAG: zinc ABC transporter substrate-binding protein [Calditrichia bacterium]